MELRLSSTARRPSVTGSARLAVVLACLLASGFLPAPAGAHTVLPVEVPAPGEDGGQEPELIKSSAVRAVALAHPPHATAHAPAFHPNRPFATGPLGYRCHPPGRSTRLHTLRC